MQKAFRVIFAYPVETCLEMPDKKLAPMLIEQTIPFSKIDRMHYVGEKRMLELIYRPALEIPAYSFLIDKDLKDYLTMENVQMKKVMFSMPISRVKVLGKKYLEYIRALYNLSKAHVRSVFLIYKNGQIFDEEVTFEEFEQMVNSNK